MKPKTLLVPAAVVTATLRVLRVADRLTLNDAVMVVEFTTVTLLADTPLPEMLSVAGAVKLDPVSVTVTVVPRLPVFGESLLSTGLAGAVTVKACAPLVPAEVFTVTLRAPVEAPAPIVNVAVILLALATATFETVTPEPLTVTEAPEMKLDPVSVTGTLVP